LGADEFVRVAISICAVCRAFKLLRTKVELIVSGPKQRPSEAMNFLLAMARSCPARPARA